MAKPTRTRSKTRVRSPKDHRAGPTEKDAELASTAVPAPVLHSPDQRELQSPISSTSANRAITAPAKVPADAASPVSSLPSQSNIVSNGAASRVTFAAASPTSAVLLSGFVDKNNWDAIQENTYVVLGHGPYQRRVLMGGILAVTVLLFQYLAYRLIGRRVDHWCRAPDKLAFLPADTWRNMSIPVEADGRYSSCTIYEPPEPVDQEENRTAVPCHEWSYDIANKADSIVSRFDLVCGREYLYDLSTLVPLFGSSLISPALGLAADRVGRKPVMVACAFTQLFATFGNTFSETYAFFLFTRFLIIAATDVTLITTFTLIHEVTDNARRSMFTLVDTAVPGTIVPPLLHAISILEPRWMLANALTIVTTGLLAAWCWLVEESPAWLVATRHLRRAEATVLLAAKENGVDVAKARSTFRAIEGQLRRLDRHAVTDPMEAVIDTIRLRRRAVSVLLARFAMDATYINLMVNDVTTGIGWEVADVLISVVCYASTLGCMRSCGIRETLSGVMFIVSTFAVLEGLAIFGGQQMLTLLVHAGLKVSVSVGTSVTLCYTAEAFPTAVRNAGISVSQVAGGMGSILGIVVIGLTGQHVFYLLSAFMILLSAAAIQWLPEVVIKRAQLPGVVTASERKAALLASLQPRGVKSPGKHR
ncbi:hypothetical protein MTO96_051809 [Rhipicephalus appendiculatus]